MVKMSDLTNTLTPSSGWQLLGNLIIPASITANDAIYAWLTDTLVPLNLSKDFFARVLQSTQESASRELQQDGAISSGYIHLSIFTPHEQTAPQRTWGFFHTERTESGAGDNATHVHHINYYLYVEGK